MALVEFAALLGVCYRLFSLFDQVAANLLCPLVINRLGDLLEFSELLRGQLADAHAASSNT